MNLTVAMRVIGGFSVISLLLVVLSGISLYNLNEVDSATEEVSQLALPTVGSSNSLKASFLNMGRLTFEAYVTVTQEELKEKQTAFELSRTNFESELSDLRKVVSEEKSLNSALGAVELVFENYVTNSVEVYSNHLAELDLVDTIENEFEKIEESADDASSLLLDFADLDEVIDSPTLSRVAKEGASLESSLLLLLTASSDYVQTETLQRADIRSQEVRVLMSQARDKYSELVNMANGQDDSGTLEEVGELISVIEDTVTGTDGILRLQANMLERAIDSKKYLLLSDKDIEDALVALSSLLELANKKAVDVKSGVNKQVSSSMQMIIVMVLISLGIAAFTAFKSVTAITKPLERVNNLLQIASSGDLTHRLDDSSNDEFGILSKNCNMLIDNLKTLIDGINKRAEQLAAASGETSAVTEQTTNSIQEQKSQISQIAAATTEMHSTSQLVSQSADDTLQEIGHADKEAEKVKQISLDNKHTIEVLARDVQEAADVIEKLHQDSASIGGILDVIRGVADQTNLLALNAAIEAARAGEQGRGFAVVADEVRTLASRTQQSTQEINSMIEVLQAGAEKAVAVMTQGKQQTEVCVAQTEKATQALDLITDAVHRAHEVSTRIEHAAREQHQVSAEISEKLESIVGIAEETTLGAQQTTQSSAEVARLADELQESIGEFKV
ncbi:HAMP domain-containing methyl-accepting chemotaxis protein [Brumicola blandensis]|uniref:Methyl-accepting chemotaxis protein n=1 Tax=Brumicola blandensis TaxID=3075611 RepID=A0AAW8R606_9ALTE|nr:methyl-accepting chemotaxis protein [Alteromonas sp. W409]MDT0584330.1 methyl-accepting chemotaxis protein [Alteromonas sp. W409]